MLSGWSFLKEVKSAQDRTVKSVLTCITKINTVCLLSQTPGPDTHTRWQTGNLFFFYVYSQKVTGRLHNMTDVSQNVWVLCVLTVIMQKPFFGEEHQSVYWFLCELSCRAKPAQTLWSKPDLHLSDNLIRWGPADGYSLNNEIISTPIWHAGMCHIKESFGGDWAATQETLLWDVGYI